MTALYAGGVFSQAGGVLASNIAKWDGSTWSQLGNPQEHVLTGNVNTLAVLDDGLGGGTALYAAGVFPSTGGIPSARGIAKWDGTSWSALGSGLLLVGQDVLALAPFDDGSGSGPALYAAGRFTSPVNHIGKWDGSSWSGLGSGINVGVSVLGVFDDGEGAALYAGGAFTGAGGIPVGHIAKWDGTSWSSLAGGTNGSEVMALAVFDDGTGPALYAGGDFTFAGGNAANRIAMWNGSSWSFLGNGMDGDVLALTVFDDGQGPALHAGGSFTSAGGIDASYIAKWDGSTWSALSGMSHPVRALAVFDDGSGPALFAGGDFTGAGGLTANYIARWNGKSWSALASGMNANVRAFAVHDDGTGGGPALFVGGAFTTSASGDSYLAKWGCEAPSPTTFCTAKTALVCGAANISATGTPSATSSNGFVVGAQPVRGCRAGLLLHSDQPVQPGVAFGGPGNGLLCLPPAGLRRAGPIDSGGTSPTACDGMFVIDLNSFASLGWTATGCNPAPGQNNPTGFLSTPGTTVNAQMWGRDSVITGQVLSDGISWVVGP